jgi:hypothetical protein
MSDDGDRRGGDAVADTRTMTRAREQRYDGKEIVAWIDAARPQLQTSRWAPGLAIHGLDVIDVLRSYIYMALARIVREAPASATRATSRRR